jgi:hypothetical protein
MGSAIRMTTPQTDDLRCEADAKGSGLQVALIGNVGSRKEGGRAGVQVALLEGGTIGGTCVSIRGTDTSTRQVASKASAQELGYVISDLLLPVDAAVVPAGTEVNETASKW